MNTPNIQTIEEIRRLNLLLLIEEHNGIQANVARLAKIPPSHLSQLVTRFTRTNGKVVILGSDMARKIERGCGKPEGWLDVLHLGDDPVENELLDIFAGLSEKGKQQLLEHARTISKPKRRART